ncbi:Acyl-[acyl-carrier-protein]--UDP-N- acetylglucosamine O-acyltransferase [Thioalkalivibrio nitratireducens DSM 14787]|uniref:Acyl-[acyl-carrier-protein]--UDP-N-acetylglucosamine O-acyltransferase n=1 Tax=Thioalkalivibrio nitratireducens (strain DSM 14787 / UNIQEM 213 / ALEN2) TaxID=1255043 RepID=L0DZ26_THIND|nr:acyl-ACP--UDP-N-acetylglucosamine O-acyltransferase [Thioalkalivibrio nitratireducens]AGA33621.1 Acyl-[acyl-carrier-protein]--UDP-N- acetylglucosamine O-acyltransferase [Thioalkalivibrio nitratireducens DSM 14787]
MIDPRADVHPSAEIDSSAHVGAFSVIGANVRIGADTWIGPHVVIQGPTEIGRENRIYQFASVGEAPQDRSYRGEPTRLVIGDRNVIRECATLSRGTEKGRGETVIGHDNLIMAYVHIAHDCIIGNGIIFSNAASLAGHVEVQDGCTLGGFTLVHQFCRVGMHAFTSMGAALNRDLPPYCLASGNYARLIGINKVGLRRKGFPEEGIQALHRAFAEVLRGRSDRKARVASLLAETDVAEVRRLLEFIQTSTRGILRAGRS